eukprot:gnl/TRDRNA2_/TRDRNA2_85682_c0_seq1.p1 gnl/TRDRNA2_/TRDRNA2_85682_c0~~gnl/TRDRNA2_/TRDRNA2_85682_c0_seq1.p1  ORF type:complete len:346 (-),score=95.66 gnl/TRDRNA2_/TRDRNA2_85682_c0_seq1:212-1249(-)
MLQLKQWQDEREAWEKEKEQILSDSRRERERAETEQRRLMAALSRLQESKAMSDGHQHAGGCSTGSAVPQKLQDVLAVEDENLQLREALNAEKQKVIELKCAYDQRKQAWKAELQKIEGDLGQKFELEERNLKLQAELKIVREQYQQALERQSDLKLEVRKLQAQLQEASSLEPPHASAVKQSRSSKNMSSSGSSGYLLGSAVQPVLGNSIQPVEPTPSNGQPPKLEMERQMLFKFLTHAAEPLAMLRCACEEVCTANGTTKSMPPPLDPPPGIDEGERPLTSLNSLAKVLALLRFAAETLGPKRYQPAKQDLNCTLRRQESAGVLGPRRPAPAKQDVMSSLRRS